MKYFIAVPHVLPARRWEVKKLESAASEEGIEIERFNSRDEFVSAFGEDIPESYLRETDKVGFPCVHVYDEGGSVNYWEKEDSFNAEQAALEFLLSNYQSIETIETIDDARFYATKYKGHQWTKVRELAKEIWREMRREKYCL